MKKYILMLAVISMGILFFDSCVDASTESAGGGEENPADSIKEYDTDQDEAAAIVNGELVIKPSKITGNSARAKFIRRGDYIWENITRTKYTLSYTSRVIDHTKGIYKWDCSGFIYGIILQDSLQSHADDLLNRKNTLHPGDSSVRVWTFYDYFNKYILNGSSSAENKYWKVFTSIDSLKKGDIIIARYDENWKEEWEKSGNSPSTGHMVIVWQIGEVDENNEIELLVYDSANSGHTKTYDTRYLNSKPVAEINEDGDPSGIGFGAMRFKISTDGKRRPYAYKWGLTSSKWYNLWEGDDIDETGISYDRLEGILFARPL